MTELLSTTFVQGNTIARLMGKELMMKTVAVMRSSNFLYNYIKSISNYRIVDISVLCLVIIIVNSYYSPTTTAPTALTIMTTLVTTAVAGAAVITAAATATAATT